MQQLEIEWIDHCCSKTESVTAQICSGRNRTEPRILKCCIRISPRILTTDPHPHSPLPTQAPSRRRVSNPSESGKLGHWRTINGCSCKAWSLGDSDRTRLSALYYSICSLCSAGQLAECQAWVNDPHQSTSANFRGRAVHVSPRISRILVDRRPQADASAIRTSLPQTAMAIRVATAVGRTPIRRSFDAAVALATTHT